MDNAPILQEAAIALQEIRARQSFPRVLHLRITECQPNLAHLIMAEEPVDNLNVRTQERHVLQSFLQRHLRTRPHAGTFDVNTDEVHLGKQPCQFHRILPLAAA